MWLHSLLRTSKPPSQVQSGRRSVTLRPRVEPLEDRIVPALFKPMGHVSGPPAEQAARAVTVMTRNLYVGADIAPAVGALASGNPTAIIGAASTIWAGALSTNFPERAEAIAEEIASAQPLLIGLQEVSLFRTGAPDSFFGNPTRAEAVAFDYLGILLGELDERGQHYAPVAVTQNFDAELTGFVAPGVLRDIRLTDRDVILARTDVPPSQLRLSNLQAANFSTNLAIPIGTTGQFFTNLCGWGAVDVEVRGQTFRFVNTHLQVESANQVANAVQVAQARELLTGPADTPLPVVLVGDFNSRADGTGTATYNLLRGAEFDDVWSQTHPPELGNTFGHDADLRNTTVNFTQRIDLVLYRGDFRAFDADVVGDELSDRTPSGLWPSDHGGVVATLGIHVRPTHDPKNGFLRSDDAGHQQRIDLTTDPAHEIDLPLLRSGTSRDSAYGSTDAAGRLATFGLNGRFRVAYCRRTNCRESSRPLVACRRDTSHLPWDANRLVGARRVASSDATMCVHLPSACHWA